jgi:TPR repeat protein
MAADQSNAAAQVLYGECLAEGWGVEINLSGAAEYYKMAADQHDPKGQLNYAFALHRGLGIETDPIGAAKYYKLAADQDSATAQLWYGSCLDDGVGVEKDLIGAARYYKMAADQNDAIAQSTYGLCLEEGHGVEKDLVSAARYYKLAADQHLPVAQTNYGRCLFEGIGVPIDLIGGARYYQMAADRGFLIAHNRYGVSRNEGLAVATDAICAVRSGKMAADQKSARSHYNYGLCLAGGLGVAIDLTGAAVYFKLAADHGSAPAQYQYGICLAEGRGVAIDLTVAAVYFKMGADQNSAPAHYHYGLCLAEGRGVVMDLIGAVMYFKLAADQNEAIAQARYGKCLELGLGLAPRPSLAARCYEKSISLGHVDGLNRLGRLLEFGKGVQKNPRRAFECYESGASKGNIEAQFNTGFCVQHGLVAAANITESLQYCEKSISESSSPDESGAFEYARCLQYGLVFDVNLEEASEFYALIEVTDESTLLQHSFRCLRALGKAILPAFPSRSSTEPTIEMDDYSPPARSLTAPRECFDYRARPIGLRPGQQIGKGESSEVKVIQDPATGERIAIKYFATERFDLVSFMREVEILSALNHPCVLRIVQWSFPEGSRCAELRTEYCERESLEAVLTRMKLRPDKAFWTATRIAIIICDVVLGMRYVHGHKIIHRDLKPSNILIRGNGRAVIGDFGSSRFTRDGATLTGPSGTVHYAAPEQFDEGGELTSKVDVWAFGFILYELLTGFPVFPRSLPPFEVIRRLRSRYRPTIVTDYGDYMEGLIGRCWSHNPSSRPSFDDILRDFEVQGFALIPGVDCQAIRDVVDQVVAWELRLERHRDANG